MARDYKKEDLIKNFRKGLEPYYKGSSIDRTVFIIEGACYFQYDPMNLLIRTFLCIEKDKGGFECEHCGRRGFLKSFEDTSDWRNYGLCSACKEKAFYGQIRDTFIEKGVFVFSGGYAHGIEISGDVLTLDEQENNLFH
ncbi:hypothetical protein ACFL43_00460 [Thermodesulfobacteriota bacterium]